MTVVDQLWTCDVDAKTGRQAHDRLVLFNNAFHNR